MRGVYLEESPATNLHRHTPTVAKGYRGRGGNASNAIPGGGNVNTRTASSKAGARRKRK